MKQKLLYILILVFFPFIASAQLTIDGSLNSWYYLTETPAQESLNRFYQGFNFKFRDQAVSNAYLNTNFRVAKIGDRSWEERFFNTYADWRTSDKNIHLRFGRQFLFAGVMQGTADGLLADVNPIEKLNVRVFGGLNAPLDRTFNNDVDRTAYGAYAAYQVIPQARIALSYYNNDYENGTAWQQAGFNIDGKVLNDFYYFGQVEYNMEREELQAFRARVSYFKDKWTAFGEINNQKPRIREDSFFRIFDIEAYNQLRAGASYQLGNYQVGGQFIFTAYEDETNNQALVTLANRWGLIGVVFQDGYAGKNLGVYGDIRYGLWQDMLTLRFYSSYYNYERQATEITENAVAVSGGFDYRPVRSLVLRAEVQQAMNNLYDNDVRGLFGLSYILRYK